MRSSTLFTLGACIALGCGSSSAPPPAPPVLSAASSPLGARAAPPSATDASTVEGPPAPAPVCRLTVTDTVGCGPRDVEALVAPVRGRIENCRGARGGKLRIHVRETSGKLSFDVEPGSSLDPTEKQCVLDALSTIRTSEASSPWAGIDIPATGFTSLITIEW